ncbi:MAG TPA: ABC transporter permease, partial [Clostridiales bacterium]|nr:ABC transporter permease [Clostridiales bacterium]
VANLPYNLTVRHSHPYNTELYMLNDEFISNAGNLTPMYTTFNVKDDFEDEMNSFLKNYCENVNPDMYYNSRDTFVEEFKTMQNSFKSVGLALSLIIGFIGLMNFVNTMLTSIISRRRELAMLQSIGMTKKQVNRMLVFEGMTYALLTTSFVLTIGLALSFLLVKFMFSGLWYFNLNFSAVPFLICIPILFILSLFVPVLSYKTVSKDSIVRRLREVE